jgi:hypothetical protein
MAMLHGERRDGIKNGRADPGAAAELPPSGAVQEAAGAGPQEHRDQSGGEQRAGRGNARERAGPDQAECLARVDHCRVEEQRERSVVVETGVESARPRVQRGGIADDDALVGMVRKETAGVGERPVDPGKPERERQRDQGEGHEKVGAGRRIGARAVVTRRRHA